MGYFVAPSSETRTLWVWHRSSSSNGSNTAYLKVFIFSSLDSLPPSKSPCLMRRTQSKPSFHLNSNLRKRFGACDALQPLFPSNERKNQHFLWMTIIWHKIGHFHDTKSIRHKNKIIIDWRQFVYNISELDLWHFCYFTIHDPLPLKPSFEKQRNLGCGPNQFCWGFLLVNQPHILTTHIY